MTGSFHVVSTAHWKRSGGTAAQPLCVGTGFYGDLKPGADVVVYGPGADEREIAALALGHVDDDERAEIDAARRDEIDSRVEDILTDKVEPVDGEETRRVVGAVAASRRV